MSAGIDKSGVALWDFAYDGDGSRVKQVVSTDAPPHPALPKSSIKILVVNNCYTIGFGEVVCMTVAMYSDNSLASTSRKNTCTFGRAVRRRFISHTSMTHVIEVDDARLWLARRMGDGSLMLPHPRSCRGSLAPPLRCGMLRESSLGLKYLLTDQLGSVVAVTNVSGALLSQQRYLPFGQVRTDVGTVSETDFGYTGQRAVGDLGLMDYHARMYDAALGRFIQPDNIIPSPANPQTWNRYSYVYNNPIALIDPTGRSGKCREEQNGYQCKIKQKQIAREEDRRKREEINKLIQAALDNPGDLSYGENALVAIANYFNIQLPLGDHWECEPFIIRPGDLFIGGFTPRIRGEMFTAYGKDGFISKEFILQELDLNLYVQWIYLALQALWFMRLYMLG
jgi:RHS repeat-associated protein